MSAPLIPLTIAGADYPYYTVPSDPLNMSTTPAGPPQPARITRTRGDHGPRPAPFRARIEITGTSLTDAYTNAYAAVEAAKAAAAAGESRVAWYGGAFDLADVAYYDLEPAGPESVTLTLELLPHTTPWHYGHLLPIAANDPRANLWTPNDLTRIRVANSSPALTRPTTEALRHAVTISGPQLTYYPLTTSAGLPDAAPYDGARVDAVGVIRASPALTGGMNYGIHLRDSLGRSIAAVISATTFYLLDLTDNVTLDSITHGHTIAPNEWWAFRLTSTHLTGDNYRYEAKAWNARTHPQGEPDAYQITANRGTQAPAFAGAVTNLVGSTHTDLAHMALAYRGAPAPTLNP